MLCHAGGSEDAYDRIRSMRIENLDGVRGWYSNEPFWRDQDRRSAGYALEHTLFTSGEKLWEAAQLQKYSLELKEDYDCGLRFSLTPVYEDGEAAGTIHVNFNKKTTDLTYHPDTGVYTAEQYGKPYADGLTGESVEFSNVILLMTNIYAYDSYGRLVVQLEGGDGYCACGGKYVPITWSKGGTYEPFRYYTEDGEELHLAAGKTYIAIVSKTSGEISFGD